MLLRADVDEHVGYIIETLNQTQMADNTIILFHADHVNAQLHLGCILPRVRALIVRTGLPPGRVRCNPPPLKGTLCGKLTRLDWRYGVQAR